MSTLLLVAYVAHHWSISASSPLPEDPTQLSAPNTSSSGSVPSQFDQRSVGDIVWGCLATIFACSWVAVHPNIPPPDATALRRSLIRFELMMWTILAPEIIVLWSAKQWIAARRLRAAYKDRGWTVKHGFFIQMGGFSLYDGKLKKGVLSPQRFGELLKSGNIEFPEVTADEIDDRSKGDGLSKGIVALQTLWFIVQLAARVKQGLSVTQLELATSGFAALNGFMYFFWWNKPLDIRLPIPICLLNATNSLKDDTQSSYSASQTSLPSVVDEKVHKKEIESTNGFLVRHGRPIFVVFDVPDPIPHSDNLEPHDVHKNNPTPISTSLNETQAPPANNETRGPTSNLVPSLIDSQLQTVRESRTTTTNNNKKARTPTNNGTQVSTTNNETRPTHVNDDNANPRSSNQAVVPSVQSAPLAAAADNNNSDSSSSLSRVSNFQTYLAEAWESRFILVEEDPDFELLDTPNVPMFFSAEVPRKSILQGSIISTSLGILFGAIHCAGWDLTFPSHAESLLWRISSSIVLGYPTVFFMVLAPQLVVPPQINVRARGKWRDIGDTIMFFVFFPLYIGARLFILLEVFIALRKLPVSATYDVQWAVFLPHTSST